MGYPKAIVWEQQIKLAQPSGRTQKSLSSFCHFRFLEWVHSERVPVHWEELGFALKASGKGENPGL